MRSRRGVSRTAIALGAVLAVVLGLLLLTGRSNAGASNAGTSQAGTSQPGTSQPGTSRAAASTARPRPPAPPPGARLFTPAGDLRPDDDDFAVRTRTTGPLLLFLPATGEQPHDYTRLLTLASQQGYHVLGLDYFNLGKSVSATCGRDAACYGDLERNRFDGSHPFAGSSVDPANSILTRTRLALGHLRATDPHGGWGAYLHGDQVQWQDVVVAGHSQGGGIAAWIAHTRSVRGVLMFGSPIVTDGTTAADWLHSPSATPAAREYAFDSTHDVFFTRIAASWRLLGLGAPVDVTAGGTPSGHALVTTLLAPGAHIGMAADSTPTSLSGEPVYLPVWTWMLRRCIAPA